MANRILFNSRELYSKLRKIFRSVDQRYCRYCKYIRIYTEKDQAYFRLFRVTGDFIDVALDLKVQNSKFDVVLDMNDFFYKLFYKELYTDDKLIPLQYKDFFKKEYFLISYKKQIYDELFNNNMVALDNYNNNLCMLYKTRDTKELINVINKEENLLKNNSFCMKVLYGDVYLNDDKDREHICCLSYDCVKKIRDVFLYEAEKTNKLLLNNKIEFNRKYRWVMYFFKTGKSEKILKIGASNLIVLDLHKLKNELKIENIKETNMILKNNTCSIYILKDIPLITKDANKETNFYFYNINNGWFCDIPGFGKVFSMSKLSNNFQLPNLRKDALNFYYTLVNKYLVNEEEQYSINYNLDLYDISANILKKTFLHIQDELKLRDKSPKTVALYKDPLKNTGEITFYKPYKYNQRYLFKIGYVSSTNTTQTNLLKKTRFSNITTFAVTEEKDLVYDNTSYTPIKTSSNQKGNQLYSFKNKLFFPVLFTIEGYESDKKLNLFDYTSEDFYIAKQTVNSKVNIIIGYNKSTKVNSKPFCCFEYKALKVFV